MLFRSQGAKVPDKWADKDVQRVIYGWDAMEIGKEMAARVFGNRAGEGNGRGQEKRQRRQSAMGVEEARDDTNATINVMRMRDRAAN